MTNPPICIRGADSGGSDFPYLCDVYLKNLRLCDGYSSLRTDVFYDSYRAVAERAYVNSEKRIACLKEDPSYIIGIIMFIPDVVEETGAITFGYVRDIYRGCGVFSSLLDDSGILNSPYVLLSFASNKKTDRFEYNCRNAIRVPEFLFYKPIQKKDGVEDGSRRRSWHPDIERVIRSAQRSIDRKKGGSVRVGG